MQRYIKEHQQTFTLYKIILIITECWNLTVNNDVRHSETHCRRVPRWKSWVLLSDRRSTVLDSPVTEQEFLEQLHELNNKINFAKELSFRETLACSDIQDIVDRLKLKVSLRRTGGVFWVTWRRFKSIFFHFNVCNCSDYVTKCWWPTLETVPERIMYRHRWSSEF